MAEATAVVDGVGAVGRVFGSVNLAHQTCLALELVLRGTLDDIHRMASPPKPHVHSPSTATTDSDNPQNLVITSLRSQVGDLVSQVTQLNSKLVQSYDRISDLEDNMHIASSNLRNSTLKISQLELERTQHLSALNTGLLVEKSHVTTELTRLMERATDEAARRGKAESARQEIEKDLDDLSAELFDRANTMVAEARLARAKSDRRVQDTETLLKGAEDAVTSMQAQMQVLREEKDRTDHELNDIRDLMGKGKWAERERSSSTMPLRLLSTHAPYQEFLLLVAHLRQIRPGASQPPPMATLLPLPFLARLVSEDSDPTLRLDAAPALNWLTRRAVSAAIHQSQLTIEPISTNSLLELLAPPGSAAAIAAFSQGAPAPPVPTAVIPCALCGTPVIGSGNSSQPPQPSTPSWRPAFFSRSSNTSAASTPAHSQTQPTHIHSPTPSVATSASFYPPSASSRLSPPLTPPPPPQLQAIVHVFRVPAAGGGAAPTIYPLCNSGWCLARLRTTCEVWRFVRRGVVEKVWAEEVPSFRQNPPEKPPVPPRRRMNVGKLFGMALGKKEDASGGGKDGTQSEEKFSPPPVMGRRISSEKRRISGGVTLPPPPPLPRRSETRVVKVDTQQKETRESEKETRVASPVEGATLFDADHGKPDDDHRPLENGHANPSFQDNQGILPSSEPLDPSAIPLPPSPISPPDQVESSQTIEDTVKPQDSENIANETAKDSEVHSSVEEDAEQVKAASASSIPHTPPPPHATASDSPPVPSRTASPAPPPVPRRAPRRPAPVLPSPMATGDNTLPDATKDGAHTPTGVQPATQPAFEYPSDTQAPPDPPQPLQDPPPPPPPSPPSRTSQPLQPEEQGAYIGDVTWEERTWKELVRLREDMFYARIGSVR